jgi:hypothetical protein
MRRAHLLLLGRCKLSFKRNEASVCSIACQKAQQLQSSQTLRKKTPGSLLTGNAAIRAHASSEDHARREQQLTDSTGLHRASPTFSGVRDEERVILRFSHK